MHFKILHTFNVLDWLDHLALLLLLFSLFTLPNFTYIFMLYCLFFWKQTLYYMINLQPIESLTPKAAYQWRRNSVRAMTLGTTRVYREKSMPCGPEPWIFIRWDHNYLLWILWPLDMTPVCRDFLRQLIFYLLGVSVHFFVFELIGATESLLCDKRVKNNDYTLRPFT